MPDDGEAVGRPSPPARIELPRGRVLDLSKPPLIMGILNATPDSFYPQSRSAGRERALAMIEDGADILDIGGESSRPGADYVDETVELERVIPVIESIRRGSEVPISVDTRKARVAREAIAAGADIVNDISGLRDDADMAAAIAGLGVPVIIMHMAGSPRTMQTNPHYENALREISESLLQMAASAIESGIDRKMIILDPGIGFGKRIQDNLSLLRGIPQLKELGYPVLIGLSRKGFLGSITGGKEVGDRLPATIVANTYAALAGADILRVHDTGEAVDLRRVLHAISATE